MNEYHKIQTVYLRDPDNNHKTLLDGQFAKPEFEYLRDNEWEFTEKVDGTNIRVANDGGMWFAGKTGRSQIQPDLWRKLGEMFEANEAFLGMDNTCLYGEGFGGRIQKAGKLYRDTPSFVLFDVKIRDTWLRRDDVEDIARKLGIETVPIIGRGHLETMVEMAREGFESQWGDFMAEGIVARPAVEMRDRMGERIITKIKRKDFRV